MYLISPGAGGREAAAERTKRRAPRAILIFVVIASVAMVAVFAAGARHVQAASASTQTAASSTDYPITVHVTASYWDYKAGVNNIEATIDSAKYRLTAQYVTDAVLAPGDYHAQLHSSKKLSKLPAYWIDRSYDIQFSDGKVSNFQVTAAWAQ